MQVALLDHLVDQALAALPAIGELSHRERARVLDPSSLRHGSLPSIAGVVGRGMKLDI